MNFMGKARSAHSARGLYDEGLRTYMMRVYAYMSAALGVTGLSAVLVASSPYLLGVLYGTPLYFLVAISPIFFAMFISSKVRTMDISTLHICYWAFSVLMGVSLSWIFLRYTGESIAKVFFISASMFGTMSIYGHITKKDLSELGSFMIMGVLGIIIASVVNLFLASEAISFAISIIAVIAFTVLTASDTQRIKECYHAVSSSSVGSTDSVMAKVSILGALTLYMDFINLFIHLLHFMGDRK